MAEAAGLHARVNVVPVAVIVGGVRSFVHVTVLEVVAVLPQPSVAVKVLVLVRKQPSLWSAPSVPALTVTAPQASVAVAVPSAAFIADEDGLQPRVVLL